MARKIATIRTIDTIDTIDGADRIEKATIDGWNIVTAKGVHNVGDQVIYVEIDAALPVHDHRLDPDGTLAKRGTKKWNNTDCHILKTIRLRGTYSQGLILPISVLDQPTGWLNRTALTRVPTTWFKRLTRRLTAREGHDVTSKLGITKYDPETLAADGETGKKGPTNPNIIGPFPTQFARKSDSERVQNLGRDWGEIVKRDWRATEKIDGQSITLINDEGTLRIASRNYEIREHPAKQWAIDNGFLDQVPNGTAVQGEWAGPGIQGNKLDLPEGRFFAFSQFENGQPVGDTGWTLDHRVPFLGWIEPYSLLTQKDFINHVDGMKSTINPAKLAEGIVFHHNLPVPALGGRATFKAINNKWLVKVG